MALNLAASMTLRWMGISYSREVRESVMVSLPSDIVGVGLE